MAIILSEFQFSVKIWSNVKYLDWKPSYQSYRPPSVFFYWSGIWNTALNQFFLRHLESSYKHSCPQHLHDAHVGRRLILLQFCSFCSSSVWKICVQVEHISWQNAILCSCFLLLSDLVVSLAVRPYSSFYSKKKGLVLWSTCWSEDVVHLAFAPVAILSNVELNAPSECHLLVHQSRHYLVDARDMAMRNLCWCFLRRSQSSSQELTCAHLTWGWTRFLASPWFFKDAWTKSGGNIEICRENLLLLRFWKLNRPVLGLIILMTIERQKNDKFWGWCYWCVE